MDSATTRLIRYLFLVFLAIWLLFTIFPLYFQFITSLKPVAEINSMVPTFWPETMRPENYAGIFADPGSLKSLIDSLIISIANTLLSLFDNEKIIKLETYNLFMQSTNSHHALSASNRKFYWNSIENYFEPINYDSNANINNDISKGTLRYPFSKNLFTAFNELEIKIKNLNQKQILENLILSGLDFTDDQLKKKINKILFNLDKLKDNYLNHTSQMMVKHNETKLLNNILQKFHT